MAAAELVNSHTQRKAVSACKFEICRPTLLIHCRMLREALGLIDTPKHHQVLAYAPEAIIEDGLAVEKPLASA